MLEIYDELKIEELLGTSEKQDIFHFNSILFLKRNEYEKTDEVRYNFLFSLCRITSLACNSENAYDPFTPAIVMSTGRSAALEDISIEDRELYKSLVTHISNSELLSRVADILWVLEKDYKCAQTAIDSYLTSAEVLKDDEFWSLSFNRVERAFRISAMLGAKSKYPQKVIDYIKSQIKTVPTEEDTFLTAKYLTLLQEFGVDDNAELYSELCLDIAKEFEKKEDWIKAREYLNVKVKYDEKLENGEKPSTLKYTSDLFILEGENNLKSERPSYSTASYFYERALVALRASGQYELEQKELHKKLLLYQKQALKEFMPISKTTDISDFVEWTKTQIKGKSFIDSLLTLAALFSPTSVKKLRTDVEENSKYFISQHLFGGVIVNENGMVTGRYPSRSFNGDKEEDEEAIRAQMINTSQLYRQIKIPSYIEPARFIINAEHSYKINDFYEIVNQNPFVPPGREYLFARGLYDGLKGDFISSSHILIPQIENSIRHLLQVNEEVTSGYSSKGIQDERPLTVTLVDYPILKAKILGEDLHFELSSLLIDRFGSNLRNRLSHGLINSNGFYSYDSIYLWWLTLRICCHPLIVHSIEKENA